MCIGKSMLVVRHDQEPFHLIDVNDHSPLLEARGLRESDEAFENRVKEIWENSIVTIPDGALT